MQKTCAEKTRLYLRSIRDHPFKTSAYFRGGGIKNWPNLPMDNNKKTADGRGVGVNNRENLPTS